MIADESWNLDFAKDNNILMLVSFFGWLLICLLLQAVSYYHYYKFKDNAPRESTIRRFTQEEDGARASLFDDTLRKSEDEEIQGVNKHLETVVEDDGSGLDGSIEEPLIDRRDVFKKESIEDVRKSFFYQTGEFETL